MTATSAAPPPIRVLGLPLSAVDLDGAVSRATAAVASGTRCRIGVLNVNKCWLALRNPDVRSFLEESELVVAETAVVWAARTLGHTGVEAAWGVVLMERLLERAHAGGWSVFLLGAKEPVVRSLAERVAQRYPGARLAGWHHGYLDAALEDKVRQELGASPPDLLLAAMGSPTQERFLASLPKEGGPKVQLGVGGSFDVHAGLKPNAPPWVRGSGFEWFYRSLHDPRLFRRYLVKNPWFVAAVLRERLTGCAPGGRG